MIAVVSFDWSVQVFHQSIVQYGSIHSLQKDRMKFMCSPEDKCIYNSPFLLVKISCDVVQITPSLKSVAVVASVATRRRNVTGEEKSATLAFLGFFLFSFDVISLIQWLWAGDILTLLG